VLSDALVRWTPRLPRLQALELYAGTPLEDELVHASISEHCPHFNSLSIYTWFVATPTTRVSYEFPVLHDLQLQQEAKVDFVLLSRWTSSDIASRTVDRWTGKPFDTLVVLIPSSANRLPGRRLIGTTSCPNSSGRFGLSRYE
jgi:hypothetical protein